MPKAAPPTPHAKKARKKSSKTGTGYSGTPLVKKLGFKEGFRAAFPGEPPGFRSVLGTLPAGAVVSRELKKPLDLILFFAKRKSELQKSFPKFVRKLSPKGMLWIAWPKKSSGVTTDLSFDVVQKAGLGAGMVDTKICAVDETWSGLRFVIRVKDRPASFS